MRQIKITVTVQQDGQLRKYADSEYLYTIDVDGELPQDKVLRFCRACLNGGGIAYEEWNENKNGLHKPDSDSKLSTYFNGYYKFDKLTEEKDSRGIVTKASYAYKVVIPYCD
jgi:hypothetical protein